VTIENLEIGDRIDARRPESLLAQPVDDFRITGMDLTTEESVRRVVRAAKRPPATERITFSPARPSQESVLPLWETYNGPTALAKVLIEEGHNDGAILAATGAAIRGAKSAGAKWPVFFTRRDLGKLRARTPQERIGSP